MAEVKWELNYVDVAEKSVYLEVELANRPGAWTRLVGKYRSVELAKEDAQKVVLSHRNWGRLSRFRVVEVKTLVTEEGEVVDE